VLETICCLAAMALPEMPTTAQAAQVSVHEVGVQSILGEIKRPGAKAVLVNVWASWCDPCRAEMPGLLKFFREHSDKGLRLILVSVDDAADRDKVIGFLAAQGVDFVTWIKHGDDMTFINALDPRWSGALPASFLFDGRGRFQQSWYGEVNHDVLKTAWDGLLSRRNGRTP
jgi:thiol-disulfide isomerase/thioredoxin